MKILFLNPYVDAEHQIVRDLQVRNIGVLSPLDSEEAWQMLQLHGTSVALAVIHREGIKGGDDGIQLLKKLKASVEQADLPVILTSSEWANTEFAAHQNSREGVNAYLHWPFSGELLAQLIDQIFVPVEKGSPQPAPESATYAFSLDESPSEMGLSQILAPPPIPDSAIESQIKIEAEPLEGEEFGLSPLGSASDLDDPIVTVQEDDARGTLALSLEGQWTDSPVEVVIPAYTTLAPEFHVSAPPLAPAAPSEELDEEDLAADLPYLFSSKGKKQEKEVLPDSNVELDLADRVGDAIVPGGAAQTPDIETLKKYLTLREQDVSILSSKLRTADERISTLESSLRAERGKCADLDRILEERQVRINDFEKEKALAMESLQVDLSELRFQNKSKSDKARLLEQQVKEAAGEIERLKDRVRSDIRKIRIREKELENKLELMKKDSEALLSGRENKIVELKRKVDLLEFNMDLLQDQYSREKENSGRLRERLSKAAQVVRVASGILDVTGSAGSAEAVSQGQVKPEGEKAS